MSWQWAALACATALALTPAADARCQGSPLTLVETETIASDGAEGATQSDRMGRIVAPILVNGQGPFRFIIDTGANRSAVSRPLAQRLGLAPIGVGAVHTVHEVTNAPLVAVDSLAYGGIVFSGGQMPVLESPVLAGEDGLLGVDGMRDRRLMLDFANRCIEIAESDNARRLRGGWTSVRGELRFGHLVMIEGSVRRRRINVLIDTGSSASLANTALRTELAGLTVEATQTRLQAVRALTAGAPILLDTAIILPRITIGGIEARAIVAFIGDFHIFELWGLADEPTLLIGMDVLSRADAIAIDYGRGSVHFRVEQQVFTGSRIPGGATPNTTVARDDD
ncbi:MAG: aspartyl protease family protein [Hyphomonadaceae bacterium]|nr:aspartyl protease family protein [Hyphomonadaceae bacterium]